MTVIELIEKHLKDNGFDGCEPAYQIEGNDEFDYFIQIMTKKKPEK